MRTLTLDPVTGDLSVEAGRLVVASGQDAIRQKLQVRLRLWQGEWFADTSVGVPYLGMLGKATEAFAESQLRQAILTCPGVAALDRFSLTVDARRRATVSFAARTTSGEVVEVADFVAGGA